MGKVAIHTLVFVVAISIAFYTRFVSSTSLPEYQLKARLATLVNKLSKLNERILNARRDLRRIEDRQKTTASFVALYIQKQNFESGEDMIYTDLRRNDGGAYNKQEGYFNAPAAGYYLFFISINVQHSNWISIVLRSRDGPLLARMRVGNEGLWSEFKEASVVVKLRLNEHVYPRVVTVSDKMTVYTREHTCQDYRLSKFEGYLLKAL